MTEKGDGAWYVISIAAVKAEVHEQTLRHYERLGLISPARKGNSPQEMAHMRDQHAAETRRLKDIIERLQRGSSN